MEQGRCICIWHCRLVNKFLWCLERVWSFFGKLPSVRGTRPCLSPPHAPVPTVAVTVGHVLIESSGVHRC